MARDSKSRVAARQPGVQIPLSPIFLQAYVTPFAGLRLAHARRWGENS